MTGSRGVLIAAAALALGLSATPAAWAAASDLDPSFGSSGLALTAAGNNAGASSVAHLPGGSFVVLGTATGSGGATVTKIARYDASGHLDTGFGDSGVATLPAFGGRDLAGVAVASRPGASGDLIVAGTLLGAGETSGDFAITAVQASDGSVDTGFGSSGLVDTPIGDAGSANANALAVDADSGEMIVGGSAGDGGTAAFALAAYDEAGALETSSFGDAGKVLTVVPGGDAEIDALTFDGTNVVAAGTARSGEVAAAERYLANGTLDSSFGGGSPVTVEAPGGGSSGASSVIVQADHDVLLGGSDVLASGGCLAVMRLNMDGSLDTTYGDGDGHADICAGALASATSLVQSPDGLYVAGYEVDAGGATHLMLARLAANGSPDATFATGGYVIDDPNGAGHDSQANAVLLDGDQPVIAGEAAASPAPMADFVIERFRGGTPPSQSSPPTLTAPPAPRIGDTLTAVPGTWTGTAPIRFTYTWLRCLGESPSGCTTAHTGPEASYTLTAADGGQHMIVEVTASNVADSATADSAATAAVLAPPADLTAPAISGSATAGQVLTVSRGAWSGSQPVTFTYQWHSCPGASLSGCSTVQSGSSATYTVQNSDVHRQIAVTVTASNGAGTATATSSFTVAIAAAPFTVPQLTGCGQHVIIGPLQASGCFKQVGETWVATGEVSVNGIFLLPDGVGAELVFDPQKLTVKSSGAWQFEIGKVSIAGHDFGPWLVYRGKFAWDFSADGLPKLNLPKVLPSHITLPAPFDASLPAITIPKLASFNFLGFPTVGSPTLKPAAGGFTLTLPVRLPGVLGGITGAATLHADESSGLQFSGVSVSIPDLVLGPLEVKKTSLSYSPDHNTWQASTSIVLPTPNHNEIGASIGFADGKLTGISAELDGSQVPIGPGVFLQSMTGALTLSPLHISGSVGISAGPMVLGKSAAQIDGDLTYGLGSGTSKLEATGTLSVLGVKLAQAALDYIVDAGGWSIDFTGQLGYLYAIKGPLGLSENIGAQGKVQGNIYGGNDFYFDAVAQVTAPLLPGIQGEVRANRKALAACASLGGGAWRTISGGFVYPWGGSPQVFTGCDLGPYVSDSHGAQGRAAAAARPLILRRGLPVAAVRVTGSGGPPIVRLAGPHHASFTVPAGGDGIKTPRYIAYRDPENDTTYVLINRPAPGRWIVVPRPGSPPVTGVQSADGLPAPRVHVTVVAHHRARLLRYVVAPLPGQSVRLLERGHGAGRVLGTARRHRGTIVIHPNGPAGRRTVLAEVLEDGLPRSTVAVTHYHAPAPASLSAPRHVHIVRRGERAVVTFARVGDARGYLVRVHSSAGSTTQVLLGPSARRATVAGVASSVHLTATVQAIGELGAESRPGHARLAPRRRQATRRRPSPGNGTSTSTASDRRSAAF